MSEFEKILVIVGIIWLAHIPFVVPFFMAARQSSTITESADSTIRKENAEESDQLMASA